MRLRVLWWNVDWQSRSTDEKLKAVRQLPGPHLIVPRELQRALENADPLHGIAQLVARLAAAFVLDPGGVTRTNALGTERTPPRCCAARRRHPPLHTAIWEFLQPMLSPRLAGLNRGAFVMAVPASRRRWSRRDCGSGDDALVWTARDHEFPSRYRSLLTQAHLQEGRRARCQA